MTWHEQDTIKGWYCVRCSLDKQKKFLEEGNELLIYKQTENKIKEILSKKYTKEHLDFIGDFSDFVMVWNKAQEEVTNKKPKSALYRPSMENFEK